MNIKKIKMGILFAVAMNLTIMALAQNENPMEPTPKLGTLEFEDGSHYSGEIEGGQMGGIGTQFFPDGTTRTGHFQDNKYLADFIANPPWSMVAIDFMMDQEYEIETFSMDLKVLSDVPDSVHLYIASFGSGKINGTPFYGGIQTQCGGYYSVIKGENSGRFIPLGRAMIFSRWDTRESMAFKKEDGGVCESSGYEGNFVSVRNGLKWGKGTYTFSLIKSKETVIIDSVLHTYVQMQVYDHKKKQTFVCGSLAFPGTNLVLSQRQCVFFELYSKRVNVNQLPAMKFICENFKVNDNLVHIPFAASVYNKNQPKYADATYQDGKFTVEIGKPSAKPVKEGENVNFWILHEDDE